MERRGFIAASTLFASACVQDDAERHELDGLVVVEDFDQQICAGTFAALERRLTALERETGLARDPLGLVFHWVFDREALPEHCRELVSGCARGRDFYSQLDMFSHELAHSHLSRLGSPRLWLREGMATMLEDTFRGQPDPTVTPSDMLPIEDSLVCRVILST